MAMTYLTRLKPEPQGVYDASKSYGVNSLVTSGDGARVYLSVKDVPAGTPLTDENYYVIHTDLTNAKESAENAADKALAARNEMLEIARGLTDPVAASGNPLRLNLTGGIPFDGVITTLAPVQAGSGDPSASNIRAISGWTGAKLTRCGKNLLHNTANTQTINGVTFTVNADGSVTANGTATGNTYLYIDADTSAFKVGEEYVSSGCPSGGSDNTFCAFLQYYRFDGTREFVGQDNGGGGRFIFAETTIRSMQYVIKIGSGTTVSNLLFRPMIRLTPIDETAYEPYRGNSYTASFNRTIYGGEFNWTTGVLKATHGYIAAYAAESLPGEWLSDRDVYTPGATPTSGAQVVYKLATPTTVQLTAQEIGQLSGANTLYGDGNIAIQGRASVADQLGLSVIDGKLCMEVERA